MDWSALLWQLLSAVLVAVVPILAVFIVKWLVLKIELVKAKIAVEQPDLYAIFMKVGEVAVRAAQQLKESGVIPTSEEAHDYAVDLFQRILANMGVEETDIEMLSGIIEAIYKEMKTEFAQDARLEERLAG